MLNSIILGDCLDKMRDIPDKSIDMVLCDLPYGTTACKWDIIIPFNDLWLEYKRILTSNGVARLFGNEPFSSYLRLSNINNFKYDWVWNKGVGVNFLHVKREPMKIYELISVFKNVDKIKYFPQMVKREKSIKKSNNIAGESSGYNLNNEKYVGKVYNEKYPETILNFSSRSKGNRGLHPTQKPVELCEYLIKTYTKEGDTVLDNCAGSGTTGVACKNTNRNYILIEKEKEYYDIILERLSKC